MSLCVSVSLYGTGWGAREEEKTEQGGPGEAAGPGMYLFLYLSLFTWDGTVCGCTQPTGCACMPLFSFVSSALINIHPNNQQMDAKLASLKEELATAQAEKKEKKVSSCVCKCVCYTSGGGGTRTDRTHTDTYIHTYTYTRTRRRPKWRSS